MIYDWFMEIRQLHAFVAVASELNFTRAADRLHTVQSAVSATIRSLEHELGTALFDRSLRQISLTSAGRALLPEARSVLDGVRAARDAVDATQTRVTGQVELGYMTSVTLVDIPAQLSRFSQQFSHVTIGLRAAEQGTAGLVAMLHSGELDLALIMHHKPFADLDLTPVARSPLRLVVPEEHPLAGTTEVSLEDLADEQFVDFREGFGVREVTDSAFRAAGVYRVVAFESMDIVNIGQLVDSGLGVAFLPEFVTDRLDHVRIVPLAAELPDMVVSVATLKGRRLSAAGRALHSTFVEGSEVPRP